MRTQALPSALLALLVALPLRAAPPAQPRLLEASALSTLVADLGAGRPLVLHFWATWCGACRDEFPRLRSRLRGLAHRGVSLALVAVEPAASRPEAARMLSRLGLRGLRSLILPDDVDPRLLAAALAEPAWDGTLPATFVFDAQGKKVQSFLGAAPPDALDEALARALQPGG